MNCLDQEAMDTLCGRHESHGCSISWVPTIQKGSVLARKRCESCEYLIRSYVYVADQFQEVHRAVSCILQPLFLDNWRLAHLNFGVWFFHFSCFFQPVRMSEASVLQTVRGQIVCPALFLEEDCLAKSTKPTPSMNWKRSGWVFREQDGRPMKVWVNTKSDQKKTGGDPQKDCEDIQHH